MNSFNHDALLRSCLQDLGKVPLLKKGEDIELAQIYQANPTSPEGVAAKEKLIAANLRLLVFVAKKHPHRGELLDRIQDGAIGLMVAAEKYDPSKGFNFTTYAYQWIRQSICRADDKTGRMVRLPNHQIDKLHQIRGLCAKSIELTGAKPSLDELAQKMDCTIEQLIFTLESAQFEKGRVISTSLMVGESREDELIDLLADSSIDIAQQVENRNQTELVAEILATLTPTQEKVIRRLFGIDCASANAREIGDELNLSRERIRQIKNQVFQKIKKNPKTRELARSLL
jgi:RNA polymerase sigma factor (sigma-70 family)